MPQQEEGDDVEAMDGKADLRADGGARCGGHARPGPASFLKRSRGLKVEVEAGSEHVSIRICATPTSRAMTNDIERCVEAPD